MQTEEYAWLWRIAKNLTPYSRMASQVQITAADNGLAVGLAQTIDHVPSNTVLSRDHDVMRELGVLDEEVRRRGAKEEEGMKFRFTWR